MDFTPARSRGDRFPLLAAPGGWGPAKWVELLVEGQVLWYKPGLRRGCLVTHSGEYLPFTSNGDDSGIHGGARLACRVSEVNGRPMGVNPVVIQSCQDSLLAEAGPLIREFRLLVTGGNSSTK